MTAPLLVWVSVTAALYVRWLHHFWSESVWQQHYMYDDCTTSGLSQCDSSIICMMTAPLLVWLSVTAAFICTMTAPLLVWLSVTAALYVRWLHHFWSDSVWQQHYMYDDCTTSGLTQCDNSIICMMTAPLLVWVSVTTALYVRWLHHFWSESVWQQHYMYDDCTTSGLTQCDSSIICTMTAPLLVWVSVTAALYVWWLHHFWSESVLRCTVYIGICGRPLSYKSWTA